MVFTYENVTSKLENLGCELLTNKEDYVSTTQKLKWKCGCQETLESTYAEISRWKGQCLECRKKNYKPRANGSKPKTLYDGVKKVFEDAGCQLLVDEENYPGNRFAVDWKCKCGRRRTSAFDTFKRSKRCGSCGHKTIAYEKFCEELKKHNWEMITTKDEWNKFISEDDERNSRIKVRAKTDKGTITEINYNKFMAGHRSKKDADSNKRKDFNIVKKAFEQKEFELISEASDYKNKESLLKYKCRCGNIASISFNAVKRNVSGCMKCARERQKDNHSIYWEEQGSEHMRKIGKTKDYKLPSGKIIKVLGYENYCIDDLLYKEEMQENDIVADVSTISPIHYEYEGKFHLYYPDIFIKSLNKFIEVKSKQTINNNINQNQAKWNTVVKNGYNLEVRVYDESHLIEKRIYNSKCSSPITEKYTKPIRYPIKKNKQIIVDIDLINGVKPPPPQIIEKTYEKIIITEKQPYKKILLEGYGERMIDTDGDIYSVQGIKLKKFITDGIYKVKLPKIENGKRIQNKIAVNKLVLKHFLPKEHADKVDDFHYIIFYKDQDRLNDNINNLGLVRNEEVLKDKKVEDTRGLPVLQYTQSMEFIAEYENPYEAYLATRVSQDNIKKACRTKENGIAGEFIWKYKIGNEQKKEEVNVSCWKTLDEFPNYKISRRGKVWNCLLERLIETYFDDEIEKVHLTKNKKNYIRSIHNLVALTYIPKPDDLEDYVVKHKNLDKSNNQLSNLMWIKRPIGKGVIQYDINMNEICRYDSIKDAVNNVKKASANVITRSCNDETNTKKSGGYIWKWANK